MKKTILFLLIAALFAGCFKDVGFKTTYVLKPLVQANSGDPTQPLTEAICHAFVADTAQWTVASYDDAVRGVITGRHSGERQEVPFATGEPYELEGGVGMLQMFLNGPRFMIIAVDTQNRLYAYTQQIFPQNLYRLYISVVFKPFRTGSAYRDGNWMFYNDFYAIPDPETE